MTATATHIRDITNDGSIALYRLSPPIQVEGFDNETGTYIEAQHEYVIVSAVDVSWSEPETYIFSADEDGEVANWVELPGSFQGEKNHEKALAGAGYVLGREQ